MSANGSTTSKKSHRSLGSRDSQKRQHSAHSEASHHSHHSSHPKAANRKSPSVHSVDDDLEHSSDSDDGNDSLREEIIRRGRSALGRLQEADHPYDVSPEYQQNTARPEWTPYYTGCYQCTHNYQSPVQVCQCRCPAVPTENLPSYEYATPEYEYSPTSSSPTSYELTPDWWVFWTKPDDAGESERSKPKKDGKKCKWSSQHHRINYFTWASTAAQWNRNHFVHDAIDDILGAPSKKLLKKKKKQKVEDSWHMRYYWPVPPYASDPPAADYYYPDYYYYDYRDYYYPDSHYPDGYYYDQVQPSYASNCAGYGYTNRYGYSTAPEVFSYLTSSRPWGYASSSSSSEKEDDDSGDDRSTAKSDAGSGQ
ncbi:hypothetical protein B0H67DRAFT_671509 [Lasiosphaeris hirsuta]|uniref:Uncharacterized protein n=1 Tax=Lasiosphaeris hirsuta TaxID=260670 RepID=A0AA40A2I6_9PEZI|nr:hypothetical protein B0H67DRAFT_671509 [Lasiosphaeris hirsuta]